MKKILSIALVAALLVSSVFAVSFSGDATLSLGYDLDTKDYGFKNGTSTTLKFGFELGSGDGASAGEGDLRAEIEGTFKVEFKEAKVAKDDVLSAKVTTLKISKANILYKDFLTVGILEAGKSADYAASYYVDDDGNPVSDVVFGFDGVPGFTYKVTAEKFTVNGGFGLNGNTKDETYNVLAYAGLDDFAVVESVKLSAAAAAKITEMSKALQFNVKGAYSQDKLSASLGLDLNTDLDGGFKVETALAAAYDFVTLDVYYFTVDKFEKNNLDAKIAASKEFGEDVKVTVKGSVDARDLTNQYETREITPELDASCTVDAFTFGAKASYGIIAKKLSASANVTYAHDMFTAKAGVNFATIFGTDNSSSIYASASIESTKLINGATVSLAYAPYYDETAKKVTTNYLAENTMLGTVTATVKVSF